MTTHFQVPLRFSPRTSDPASIGARIDPLDYTARPVGMKQPRLDGRLVLTPKINLARYTCRAVIDWIEIAFQTECRTQARHISDYLAKELPRQPHVWGPSGDEHFTGCNFTVRIQEPAIGDVLKIESLIRAYRGLEGHATIESMEVALDWYPNDHSDQARWEMVAVLQRHFLSRAVQFRAREDRPRHVHQHAIEDRSTKPNFTIRRPSASESMDDRPMRTWLGAKLKLNRERERILRLSGHEAPFIDSTFYHGRDGAPAMIRIQNKVTDRRDPSKGTFESLEPEERRARIEVTLRPQVLRRLGLEKPEDLVGFQFAKLRKELFSFWLPTIEGGVPEGDEGARSAEIGRGTLQLKVFKESGVYGIDVYEKAWRDRQAETRRKLRKMDLELLDRPRQRSRKNGNLVAYDNFNRRTEKALRRLGKAWPRARIR